MKNEDAWKELRRRWISVSMFAESDADREYAEALDMAISALERDIPKRVEMKEWKGYRNTRYKCPGCGKNARNNETFCHKCGQRIVFPNISFTPYIPGERQETIITWPDAHLPKEETP